MRAMEDYVHMDFARLSDLQRDISAQLGGGEQKNAPTAAPNQPRGPLQPPPTAAAPQQLPLHELLDCHRYPFTEVVRCNYSMLDGTSSRALCARGFGSGCRGGAPSITALPGTPGQFERVKRELLTLGGSGGGASEGGELARSELARAGRELTRIRRRAESACREILQSYLPPKDLVRRRGALLDELATFLDAVGRSGGGKRRGVCSMTLLLCGLNRSTIQELRASTRDLGEPYATRARTLLGEAELLLPGGLTQPDGSHASAWRQMHRTIKRAEAEALNVAKRADVIVGKRLEFASAEYLIALLAAWCLLRRTNPAVDQVDG